MKLMSSNSIKENQFLKSPLFSLYYKFFCISVPDSFTKIKEKKTCKSFLAPQQRTVLINCFQPMAHNTNCCLFSVVLFPSFCMRTGLSVNGSCRQLKNNSRRFAAELSRVQVRGLLQRHLEKCQLVFISWSMYLCGTSPPKHSFYTDTEVNSRCPES